MGGLGLLVSQLNNYTLSPISDDRVSEAASVNSAAGSFGLSFGLAFAGGIMPASLSTIFIGLSDSSAVLPPTEQQQVAAEELLVGGRAAASGAPPCGTVPRSSRATQAWPRTGVQCVVGRADGRRAVGVRRRRPSDRLRQSP